MYASDTHAYTQHIYKESRKIVLMNLFAEKKLIYYIIYIMHQIRSVTQSFPTLCDPMNRSKPGLSVHHQLPEFTETHVH